MLAARDRFYLSYGGRSVRDNAERPPSVLIAELLDVLVTALAPADAGAAARADVRARLVVEHPLQGFASVNFAAGADPRRRSYHAEYCDALLARIGARRQRAPAASGTEVIGASEDGEGGDADDSDDVLAFDAPRRQRAFFAAPLASPPVREVTIDELILFFFHPCRYLLRERLGIVIEAGAADLPDDEPFLPEFRARDALAARLLPHCLAGRRADELLALA
jgi:exodeoxyribonuclease V gamma subunit